MSGANDMPVEDLLRAVGMFTLGKDPSYEAVRGVLWRLAEVLSGSIRLTHELAAAGAMAALQEAGLKAPPSCGYCA